MVRAQRSGLLLPPGVVQPFFLRFHHDDLHIMAFFLGHPVYEAVEAMIVLRAGGGPAIRAILTRHDQSQIDHINDDDLLSRMRGAQREIHRREIDLTLDRSGPGRRARLVFTSHAGEAVVLEVVTTGEPDPRGAGLTDPGGHSARSSLPLMWRHATALAGPQTTVTIDGAAYAVRLRKRAGAVVGAEGYYTAGHSMGVIRAGAVSARPLTAPDRLDVGGEWSFEIGGDVVVYRIAGRGPDGALRFEKADGSGETTVADVVDGRLAPRRISVPGDSGSPAGLTLAFDDNAGFSLGVAGANDLVTGRVAAEDTRAGAILTLRPVTPDWAMSRAVRVDCALAAGAWTFETTIGEA